MLDGSTELDSYMAAADDLCFREVDVVVLGEERYPRRLAQARGAPPILFCWGNLDLMQERGVGMCGSRHASEKGLEAARVCGLEVAGHGLVVISGYAKGVDTETHLAALGSGGRTVIVLAEGIDGFRRKRVFDEVGFEPERVLVLSQFAPTQRWNVGAAMTRNGIITGLGRALVVIEAGETGGTLNAGLQALEMGRPVLALQFASQDTPAGNQALFDKGAVPIRGRQHLGKVLDVIKSDKGSEPIKSEQLNLPGW
jgi:DNA processing protein